MKKTYQSPVLSALFFMDADIITTSGTLDERILDLNNYIDGDKVKFGATN